MVTSVICECLQPGVCHLHSGAMAGDVPEQLLLAVAAPDETKTVKLAFGVVERAFSLLR
jgi:hypothetical protein